MKVLFKISAQLNSGPTSYHLRHTGCWSSFKNHTKKKKKPHRTVTAIFFPLHRWGNGELERTRDLPRYSNWNS